MTPIAADFPAILRRLAELERERLEAVHQAAALEAARREEALRLAYRGFP